jgi:hypothetical protein
MQNDLAHFMYIATLILNRRSSTHQNIMRVNPATHTAYVLQILLVGIYGENLTELGPGQ